MISVSLCLGGLGQPTLSLLVGLIQWTGALKLNSTVGVGECPPMISALNPHISTSRVNVTRSARRDGYPSAMEDRSAPRTAGRNAKVSRGRFQLIFRSIAGAQFFSAV